MVKNFTEVIPNYKKFLTDDPLADSDSSDSDYDPNSNEESTSSESEDYSTLKNKVY